MERKRDRNKGERWSDYGKRYKVVKIPLGGNRERGPRRQKPSFANVGDGRPLKENRQVDNRDV
jgi:hypothetical protein